MHKYMYMYVPQCSLHDIRLMQKNANNLALTE